MNDLTNLLLKKVGIYREFESIDLKQVNINKRIDFYRGINLKYHYHAIFVNQNQTPLSNKGVDELNIIFNLLKDFLEHEFKKKILILKVKVSKKVEEKLKLYKWRIIYGAV
jgi:hypothetical protein